MVGVEDIGLIEYKNKPITVTIADRIALSLLSGGLSVVSTDQLERQKKALHLLFDNAEKIVEQQYMVAEFVKKNPINDIQIDVLNKIVFGLHALGLFVETLDKVDRDASLAVVHDGGKMTLDIDISGRVHTSFSKDGRTSNSLLNGWVPTDFNLSLDAYLAREFDLNK